MRKLPRKPNGVCRIKTGKEGNPPIQFDYGIVEQRVQGAWRAHPNWERGSKEFTIELLSNELTKIHQSHLAMFDGKKPFCIRAHRGSDGIGVAQRRMSNGSYKLIECDPANCVFCRDHTTKKAIASELSILRGDGGLYNWCNLEAGYDKKNQIQLYNNCSAYQFLTFALITPTGEYAHAEGEYCYFQTRSEVNHQRFKDKLLELYVKCHGNLKGLRLKLVHDSFGTSYGTNANAWSLRVPEEGASFEEQQLQAARRRQVVDYDAAIKALPSSTEMAVLGEERNLKEWLAAENPAALIEQQALDTLDKQKYEAEYIDPESVRLISRLPVIIEICKRLQLPHERLVNLGLYFEDEYPAINYLRDKFAKPRGIPVDDILRRHGYESFIPEADAQTMAAIAANNPDSEVKEEQRERAENKSLADQAFEDDHVKELMAQLGMSTDQARPFIQRNFKTIDQVKGWLMDELGKRAGIKKSGPIDADFTELSEHPDLAEDAPVQELGPVLFGGDEDV